MSSERSNALARLSQWAESLARQLVALLAAFIIVVVILLISGYNPLEVLQALLGSFVTDFYGMIRWATPLILTALATAVAFRAKVWNIGMDGQLFVGAIAGGAFALYVAPQISADLGVIAILGVATIGGALWALPAAVLRARWGVPEIITTILLIEIAALLVSWLVLGPMKGRGRLGASQSTDMIAERLWLRPLVSQEPATVGIFISLTFAVFIAWYFSGSGHGLEISLFGDNRGFAAYAGMNNRWIFVRTMLTSGALAGLAGGLEVLGSMHRLPNDFAANLGFQGIAVSLVARNNPLGIIVAGLFFGGLKTSGTALQLHAGAPRDLIDIISAIVILTVTARVGYTFLRNQEPAALSRLMERILGRSTT